MPLDFAASISGLEAVWPDFDLLAFAAGALDDDAVLEAELDEGFGVVAVSAALGSDEVELSSFLAFFVFFDLVAVSPAEDWSSNVLAFFVFFLLLTVLELASLELSCVCDIRGVVAPSQKHSASANSRTLNLEQVIITSAHEGSRSRFIDHRFGWSTEKRQ